MKLATIYLPARVDQLMRQLAGYDHGCRVLGGYSDELTINTEDDGQPGPGEVSISVALVLNKLHSLVEQTPPGATLHRLRLLIQDLETTR